MDIEQLESLNKGLIQDKQQAVKSQRKVEKQREQQKIRAEQAEAERDEARRELCDTRGGIHLGV